MFKRLKWNNGICKKTGRPWIFLKRHGFRGPSVSTHDHVYTDGAGNFIYVNTFSKINSEYEISRTPQVKEKEIDFQQREIDEMEAHKLDAKDRKGIYAPTRWEKICNQISKPFSYLFYGSGVFSIGWHLMKWIREIRSD